MRRRALLSIAALGLAACGADAPTTPRGEGQLPLPADTSGVVVSIAVDQDRAPISPLVYGSNQDVPGVKWTVRRYGGNRLTGYDWENNASNAGSDYLHQSDLYLLAIAGIPSSEAAVPARAVTAFHDQSLAMGAQSIVTLQMAGWVAADAAGPVSTAQAAPSARWVAVQPKKNAPFAATPSTTDGAVYMDEEVNFLVGKYGPASSATGVQWYSLDNEPALWSSTHPRIHPQPVGAAELVDRSIALAGAVKAVDPSAKLLGPAAYGMAEFVSLQDAPDWNAVKGGREWYIDYYLDRMRAAEATAGRRLLDALDVHWYPEARGDHRVTDAGATTPADVQARLQAPRTLWDSTYRENSWIGQWMGAYLPLVPRLKRSIDAHYPGTRLAFTEYDFGAGETVSGGIAQADVLGVFGRYGVDLATRWGIEAKDAYAIAAFRLFRDYDGAGGAFGATRVRATTADTANVGAYASIDAADAGTLHLILLNRASTAATVRLALSGGPAYTKSETHGFDATSSALRTLGAVTNVSATGATVALPAMSAVHVVLRK